MEHQDVKEYYSNITVNQGGQMETQICSCASDKMPPHIRQIARKIPEEITTRFYGCGSPLPDALEGCTVLDLGCGTGRDVYIAAALVGKSGKVIGVDMNDDQLAIARKYQTTMAEAYGYDNVVFHKGFIEDLREIGIPDESVDVVISNCVINLAPDKEKVFREIWRVLKPGGELFFSDIFADRRVPDAINHHPVLVGECLGGCLYIEDFRRMMRRVGWEDFRYTTSYPAAIHNPDIEALVGNIQYSSRTVRAFKLPHLLEDICEQYGQIAIYNGGIEGHEHFFDLDDHHRLYAHLPLPVCGNSCAMLEHTRFAPYFTIIGDRSRHFGAFDGCASVPAPDAAGESGGGCCC